MSYLGQGLGLGREERFTATATAGQTTVSVGDDGRSISYTPNYVDVYLNGSKQVNGSDVTVSSGTSIVFASALTAGDVVDVVAPGYFQPADTVSRSLGGTFLGPVNLPSGGLNVGNGQLKVDSSGRVTTNGQPAFRARANYQTKNADTTIDYANVYLNDGGHYNSATSTFTAPVAGVYIFGGMTRLDANYSYVYTEVYINGTRIYTATSELSGLTTTGFAGFTAGSFQIIVKLAANDAVKCGFGCSATTGIPIHGQTHWYGYLLG